MADLQAILLGDLTERQKDAVSSEKRRLLVVAGAGSGKTEIMARRVAWWTAVEGVPKDTIVAFTFTEKAADELKFRIRSWIQKVTSPDEDVTLGGMYVGTIHGFCLRMLREIWPDDYHNFDVMDDAARLMLLQRGFTHILGLKSLQAAMTADSSSSFPTSQMATIDHFLQGYDLLNEYNELDVTLKSSRAPYTIEKEADWTKAALLNTDVGDTPVAKAFGISAARYYAYIKCRRFLDFSTSQAELVRMLSADAAALKKLRKRITYVLVDEFQDINSVQDQLIRILIGSAGALTAVGDHRQAIYAWRGGRVDLMGAWYDELEADAESETIELEYNFRSTPRIIEIANSWADTIDPVQSMGSPHMEPGNEKRTDEDDTHVALLSFVERSDESAWIANAIEKLVTPHKDNQTIGARHDTRDGERGIAYSDIAVLIRSSTDARSYMESLEDAGIPAIFRAGPDLFTQPEILLFLGLMGNMVGVDAFWGGLNRPASLPRRIRDVLGCDPKPKTIVPAACNALRSLGFSLSPGIEDRLLLATDLIRAHLFEGKVAGIASKPLKTRSLKAWLAKVGHVRRVFPQRLYHWLMSEAEVAYWNGQGNRYQSAMFHLGQFSNLIKGIETPGWSDPMDLKYQIIALGTWGSKNARTEEAPLLVQPDAVTITTIHAAKGLEFPVVFLADVRAHRFPNRMAKTPPAVPFDGTILCHIDPQRLADNKNNDDERRLMYVALTRAERFLFVSRSGKQKSKFFRALEGVFRNHGAEVGVCAETIPDVAVYLPSSFQREIRLATSFSDLRYYLECPHDFYLRKVLGFAPTIDQAFGYGRGVHNLMRMVHTDPASWASLAKNRKSLEAAVQREIGKGLFYLRYTVGEPFERMKRRAQAIVTDYVVNYAPELQRLLFEPEKEFETLIEEEEVLVSGAIDVIRLDDPPRVTLVDFKSGEKESDIAEKLDEEEMRLQISLYGLAAKHELEFEPERGLVRYLGEDNPTSRQLDVPLDESALANAKKIVAEAAGNIKRRKFHQGPKRKPRDPKHKSRCQECDHLLFCPMKEAHKWR